MRLVPPILGVDRLPKSLKEHGGKCIFFRQAEDAFHGLQGVNLVNQRAENPDCANFKVETLIVQTS